MLKKIVLITVLILFIVSSLSSQTTIFKKVKRLPKDSLRLIAKDTTMIVEILTITKIKGTEINLKKNGLKIKRKKKNVYILKCASDDNQSRIIISLSSKIKGYSKVKVGKKYKLFLIPYFEEDCMPGDGYEVINIDNLIIPNIRVLGINLYLTPNLKGLFYLPYI
jgi:hypothetical protein